jgi:amino acid adenylation domain-containing protein
MTYLLHHVLTESAARFPDREAVRMGGKGWTYRELDRLSGQLAVALQGASVQRGDRVGIYVHKSFASVLSVFGIMKAGGAYVPLDPNAPAKRLAYITRNCAIRVLVTSAECLSGVAALLQEGSPIETVILTDSLSGERQLPQELRLVTWEGVQAIGSDQPSDSGAIETDLAYILYTSGSTGDPKGVMISHRTIFTFVNWCAEKFRVGPDDRVTSHAPLHFDLSTFDIYVTIKAGGTVVLVPEKMSIFPIQLVRLLQDEKVTVTYLVPSILSMMVSHGKLGAHDLSSLRAVLFAGEVFPIRYLRQLVAFVPQAEYYNLYGPTETNVCTYHQVRPEDLLPDRDQPVPIGRACENTEVFAVDDEGNRVLVPGREGELWVRGSCVAQGYWGDAEKTAKGFVVNPFQTTFQETAYRTGDIVVLDQDGVSWRYVGRRDHMVKSRGYRIELGEIEAALYSHPEIREAAAVAVPDDLVGNRIKAYVVRLKNNGLSVRDIDALCRQRLPRYMVPESIEFLDALPKTSSGKVDRSLLARR